MKTITRLFLVALIALGMTACSNEDEMQMQGKAESTVSIKVVPSSNGPVVRSVGDLSGGSTTEVVVAESAIKSLQVYLFDDLQGGISAGSGSSTGSAEVTDIITTSGPKTIIVVANCTIIGEITNKSQLLAKIENLPVNIAYGLPMTGMTETPVVVKPGYNIYGNVQTPSTAEGATANIISTSNLPLIRINARVAITSAKLELASPPEGQVAFFDGLSDVQVAMFNVPKASRLFPLAGETVLAMNENFLQGAQWVSTAGTYTVGTDNTAFLDGVTSAITFPITPAAAPYYYVNENTSETAKEQMMIVLRAKPMKGAVAVEAEGLYTTGGYTYYPVWVNAAKTDYSYAAGYTADSKILRNTQYNISLVIKGIGNPTIDPPAESWLDVAVSVEDWKVVSQGVIW